VDLHGPVGQVGGGAGLGQLPAEATTVTEANLGAGSRPASMAGRTRWRRCASASAGPIRAEQGRLRERLGRPDPGRGCAASGGGRLGGSVQRDGVEQAAGDGLAAVEDRADGRRPDQVRHCACRECHPCRWRALPGSSWPTRRPGRQSNICPVLGGTSTRTSTFQAGDLPDIDARQVGHAQVVDGRSGAVAAAPAAQSIESTR
jgi:hypothetical protein